MAITPLPLPTPAGVVADAGARIGELDEVMWAARADAELVGTIEEVQALRARLAALEAVVLAEVDARDLAKRCLGWGSTGDWYTHLAGLRRGQGRRVVDQARQLAGDRGATLSALREGAISPDQAGVVLDAIDRLPSPDPIRDRGEQVLLEEAGRINATDLARAGRHLAEVVDPDRTERETERALDREDRAAHLGRFLSITEDGIGGVRLKGRGTTEDGARLRAALLPLTAPVPAVDPDTCEELPDPRDHGARLWDALVQTAEHALATDLPPTTPRRPTPADGDHRPRHPHPPLNQHRQAASLGRRAGLTEDGLELPPSVLRRLACDADIIPAVLGTNSEVLDVGRTHRLVTTPIWQALVLRDQHCAFPGCTRPPVMCHVDLPVTDTCLIQLRR